jgi:antitoxin (DNA-binding transcriptional repressor) of toxin-antitoxin stability system
MSAGVRELRQNASRYLEEVAAGESIDIIDRGHLVARVVPITGDPRQDLINSGEIVQAANPLCADEIRPDAYRIAGRGPSETCGATSASVMRIYVDTSALVKLVVAEGESQPLPFCGGAIRTACSRRPSRPPRGVSCN